MQNFKRIISVSSAAILAVCFGAWLFFGWSGTGWKVLAIPTGSMRPAMPPGSMVFVHRVHVSSLKAGDVITYTNPINAKKTISHRIIKTYSIGGKVPGFVTKGDANPSADVPIPEGLVKGKVVSHLPYVGYALLESKNPWVILPIVYVAALLIMIEEVGRLAEYYRRWIVYRFPGYRSGTEVDHTVAKRVSMGAALTSAFVIIGLVSSPVALAALRSNTVVLANNTISVGKICDNNGQNKGNHANLKGSCNNNGNGGNCGNNKNSNNSKNCNQQCSNNVNVNNTTTQIATSGNAKSTGGNATSGNASNSSTTSININVSNC